MIYLLCRAPDTAKKPVSTFSPGALTHHAEPF